MRSHRRPTADFGAAIVHCVSSLIVVVSVTANAAERPGWLQPAIAAKGLLAFRALSIYLPARLRSTAGSHGEYGEVLAT
jgi:hypothetical protein